MHIFYHVIKKTELYIESNVFMKNLQKKYFF